MDGVSVREKKGSLTGPSPVDRGKPGSKIHVLSDRAGLPLTVASSATNSHASLALKPLVMAIPAVKSHRWVIARTITSLAGYRRLTLRYERKPEHFLTLGAALPQEAPKTHHVRHPSEIAPDRNEGPQEAPSWLSHGHSGFVHCGIRVPAADDATR